MNTIYKCSICGNIVELLHIGEGELICCGKPMELLREKTEDQGKEKHVPIMVKNGRNIAAKVGEIPHPMEENHYIEWIEIISKKGNCKKFLQPGDLPEAVFETEEKIITVRIYCNIHGLWKN